MAAATGSRAERIRVLLSLLAPVFRFIPEERLIPSPPTIGEELPPVLKVAHITHHPILTSIKDADIVIGIASTNPVILELCFHNCDENTTWVRIQCHDEDLEALSSEVDTAIILAIRTECEVMLPFIETAKVQAQEIITKLQ
jgi:hypothetical protein